MKYFIDLKWNLPRTMSLILNEFPFFSPSEQKKGEEKE